MQQLESLKLKLRWHSLIQIIIQFLVETLGEYPALERYVKERGVFMFQISRGEVHQFFGEILNLYSQILLVSARFPLRTPTLHQVADLVSFRQAIQVTTIN